MADEKQFPQPEPQAPPQVQQQPQQPYPQPQPVRVGMSGTTQVITAGIGAIATISGALIAANWGRGHEPAMRPTPAPTFQQADGSNGGTGVFPPNNGGGSGGSSSSGGGDSDVPTGDASTMLGQWRGAGGAGVALITQNQDGSIVVASQVQTPNGILASSGQGQIDGNIVRWDFANNAGVQGHCEAQMSADGHQLQGGCRHVDNTTEPVNLVR